MPLLSKIWKQVNPEPNPDLELAFIASAEHLPTLWLLGKTGAGKSSLIQTITGDSKVTVGDGFRPCTRTADSYDFPPQRPLLRFLDTRGLGEADYCAEEDIATCQHRSHALVVVMRADEPEQSAVLRALRQIKQSGHIRQLLLVHTAIAQLPSQAQQQQCITHNREQVKAVWSGDMQDVAVDFELDSGGQLGIARLQDHLAHMLPMVAQLMQDEQHSTREEKNFAKLRAEILWYCGAAGASDAIPAVGLVSVPAIQAKLLHSLANQYGVDWNKRALSEFLGTLGAGFGIHYAGKLGIRQLVKLIPGYGQTVGAASAAALSFCTTFAIGRAACKYLYHKSKGEPVSPEAIQALYRTAFDSIKEVAKGEADR